MCLAFPRQIRPARGKSKAWANSAEILGKKRRKVEGKLLEDPFNANATANANADAHVIDLAPCIVPSKRFLVSYRVIIMS